VRGFFIVQIVHLQPLEEFGVWSLEFGVWSLESGIWNHELEEALWVP